MDRDERRLELLYLARAIPSPTAVGRVPGTPLGAAAVGVSAAPYCSFPRHATGQTAMITPSRIPNRFSCRCTAWSV
jgi:hypothetical protein